MENYSFQQLFLQCREPFVKQRNASQTSSQPATPQDSRITTVEIRIMIETVIREQAEQLFILQTLRIDSSSQNTQGE